MIRGRLLKNIAKASTKPGLFHRTGTEFWTDPYISKHVLNAHLDPHIDDASRRHRTIRNSAEWISKAAENTSSRNLLDLGCGPGLYCQEFSKIGFHVTGIDFSPHSISHAKKNAGTGNTSIEYICKSYLDIDYNERFDIVTLIYGGFCVHSEGERERLLQKIWEALKPGGYFVFDVFTKAYIDDEVQGNTWYLQKKNGFWHPRSHAVLLQCHNYENKDSYLKRYIIVPAIGKVRYYDLWYRCYDRNSIEELLKKRGWKIAGIYGDLTGADYEPDGNWVGIVCSKPRY